MRARTTATVVLAGAVMVLTAGCNFISPQTTTEHYDASDGTSTNVGDIQLRNAMVFTDDDGDTASLSVTLLNTSTKAADVRFQYDSFGGTATKTVPIDGSAEVRRGTQGGDDQLILTGIDKKPGTLVKIFVQSGTAAGKNFTIPVLDGSFEQYATLLPSPQPTVESDATSTPLPFSTEDPTTAP